MKKLKSGDVVEINGEVVWVCDCTGAPLNGKNSKQCQFCYWNRPTQLAPDRAKRAAKSKPSASRRSKSGAAGNTNRWKDTCNE